MNGNQQELTNKALILHDVLKKYNSSHSSTKKSRFVSGVDFWKKVFRKYGFEFTERQILKTLISLEDLVDQLEKDVLSISGADHQLYLKYIPNIRKIFDFSKLKNTQDRPKVSGEMFLSLRYTSEVLKISGYEEIKLSNEKIKEISKMAEEIIARIEESHLPGDLKEIVISQMRIVKEALDRYEILGGSHLREPLEQLIGKSYLAAPILKENQEEEIVKDASDVVGRFSKVAESAHKYTGYLKSGEYILKLLGMNQD
ncbi:hypothetical protein [Acanthopleuribacter pedis]|uniref:Uncharacterized protein n=1 Tax=Acanthopleuribacter pedis TaxID=442870 RepID=A0A8J7QE28_9BACT|nr:hypothetical protein [Acanthopleuribacter pedis]MBO1322479.1 hypothetical protein [Acanthopleuribacter pedis]